MAVTLLQFWKDQLAIYQAEQTVTQSDLGSAQARLAVVNAKLATDQKALAQAGSDILAVRAELATVSNPADANPLIARLTALIITQRLLQGAVLDDQDEIIAVQSAIDSASATLARATAKTASVQATIAAVQPDDTRRISYKTAITAPPLSTLKTDATSFLASATVTHAATRIGVNFPVQILAIAAKRHDTRVNRLKALQANLFHAQDALATENAADDGLSGTATEKRIAFDRAQEALADYVATAASRFTSVQAVMTMLEAIELDTTGTIPDVLTNAEKAQLTALAAAGATAEPTAQTLDADLQAVFDARDALDAQILTSIAANVDTLATDSNIAAKRSAIDAAKTAFSTALNNFIAANKHDLDAWEASVPDSGWKVLLSYLDGRAALTELAATDPAGLATAMDTAENDLATALGAAAIAQRRIDYITDAVALREELLGAAQDAIAARLPSAIRGDSY
jgi:hypothetical protein